MKYLLILLPLILLSGCGEPSGMKKAKAQTIAHEYCEAHQGPYSVKMDNWGDTRIYCYDGTYFYIDSRVLHKFTSSNVHLYLKDYNATLNTKP